MPVETDVVNCPAGQFTKIADNKTNCSFRLKKVGGGKLFIGTTVPAANEAKAVSVPSGEWQNIGSMSGTEDVYVMPNGSQAIDVEVMRG